MLCYIISNIPKRIAMKSGDRIVESLSEEARAPSVITNYDRSVILTRSFFPEIEGDMEAGEHLKLGLCVSGGGKVIYGNGANAQRLNWNRGDILLTASKDNSRFKSPNMEMIGLAIDVRTFMADRENVHSLQKIENLPSQVLEDKVIRSIVTALWTCAEFHGTQSAFIEEGINIILERITQAKQKPSNKNTSGMLSKRQLNDVSYFIQSHLAIDLSVAEIATQIGMGTQQFSRSLKATTGRAPYTFLVEKRMEAAKRKLAEGSSVIDTSLSVGYTNPSKFTSAFKRIVGCTPTEWKKQR
jgi:AraC family transcriptional regulator